MDRSKPFHPPNILGVEKKDGYVIYDLLQLLALFYHRAILKVRALLKVVALRPHPPSPHTPPPPPQRHGLWDQTVSMETDTLHHQNSQEDSAHVINLADLSAKSLRRRFRKWSSSTQQPSVAGRFRTKDPGEPAESRRSQRTQRTQKNPDADEVMLFVG